jgi:hypothetical protein
VRGELARPKLAGCQAEHERRRRESVPVGTNLHGPIAEPIDDTRVADSIVNLQWSASASVATGLIPGNVASTTPRGFRMRWMVSTAERTS